MATESSTAVADDRMATARRGRPRVAHPAARVAALAGLLLVAGCEAAPELAAFDTANGTVAVTAPSSGPVRIRRGAAGATLDGYRDVSVAAVWRVGAVPVLVLRGRTAACPGAMALVAVRRARIEVFPLPTCGRSVSLAGQPDALDVTVDGPRPMRWTFRDGLLLGPLPVSLGDDTAGGAARRRRRVVHPPLDEPFVPPRVSPDAGPEVVPPSVRAAPPAPPSLRLD